MYRSLMATIFAAGCAAVFVGIVPPPGPASAQMKTSKPDVIVVSKPIAATKSAPLTLGGGVRRAGCENAWPYYEVSCLRDSGRHNGDGDRTNVRTITLDKIAGDRIQTAQR
jgi:hypothetical protein